MSLKPYNLRKQSTTFYIIILYQFCMDTSHSNKYLSTSVILEMYAEYM